MLDRLDSPLLKRPNQLLRLDFRPPTTLLPPRLGGLLPAARLPLSIEAALPSTKLVFSIFLLSSLRRLPCLAEPAGLRGASSAGRLVPVILPLFGGVDLSVSCPLTTAESVFFVGGGVWGGVGTLGESGGGGILVPSVMLPKFKSSAGSSNRGLAEPLTRAGMTTEF